MQRLEVSCAVQHIYIYVVRRQRVKNGNDNEFKGGGGGGRYLKLGERKKNICIFFQSLHAHVCGSELQLPELYNI